MVDVARTESAAAERSSRDRSREWAQEVWALTRRWYIQVIRERLNLFFSIAQPAIWLVFFAGAIGRAVDRDVIGTQDYLGFVLPGIFAFTIVGNGVAGAMPLLWDKETGYLDKLMSMPIARSSVIVSRFLFQLGLATAQIIMVLLIALVMGVSIATGVIGVIVMMIVAGFLTLSVAAILAALVYRVPGHGTFFAITGFVMVPLLFLSSAFVPVDVMPTWMAVIARVNPLTYAIEAMRILVLDGWHAGLVNALGGSALFAALCLGVGTYEFRRQTGQRLS